MASAGSCHTKEDNGSAQANIGQKINFLIVSAINLTSHCSDLITPDFLLWGYLCKKVYVNKTQTIADFKNSIRTKIRSLESQMLRAVMENILERAVYVNWNIDAN